MALLVTAKLNYQRTRSQLNQKQFEQVMVQKTYQNLSEKLDSLKTSCKNNTSALESNAQYQKLQAYATTYELKGESLSSQIELLENQAENYKELMKKGIEESTSLWCFG